MMAGLSSGVVPAARTEVWQPRTGPREQTLGGFLRLLECHADECHLHADAFARLREGSLQAVVVHDVYAADVLQAVVDRLERHDPPFLQTWFPEKFRSWFYGRNLNLSHPALDGYFDEAAAFHRQLAPLFPSPGLVAHVGELLARLDGCRPFLSAPGPGPDTQYMFTTLRAHQEGGYIPPHFDNEQALRPTYRHLKTLVRPHMTSFVLVLQAPEHGGALEVFDLRVDPSGAQLLSDDEVTARPDVTRLASVQFHLPAGAMIVLDSGRYLHRLTPAGGARKRWTACSFMAVSRGGEASYCWG